jgi:hypothetical protein
MGLGRRRSQDRRVSRRTDVSNLTDKQVRGPIWDVDDRGWGFVFDSYGPLVPQGLNDHIVQLETVSSDARSEGYTSRSRLA